MCIRDRLTADYVFIQTVVTVDADFIDGSLAAFVATHFQVDGVAHAVYFHRFEAVEQKMCIRDSTYSGDIKTYDFVYNPD